MAKRRLIQAKVGLYLLKFGFVTRTVREANERALEGLAHKALTEADRQRNLRAWCRREVLRG